MDVQEQIQEYIDSLPESKQDEILQLHELFLQILPESELWFLDGKNSEGKTVSNPNIGYGRHTIQYADGTSRPFYQIGLSVNKTGISVYILGIPDKSYLADTYGDKIGKANVTGYCIKFKKIKDIHIETLKEAVLYGVKTSA